MQFSSSRALLCRQQPSIALLPAVPCSSRGRCHPSRGRWHRPSKRFRATDSSSNETQTASQELSIEIPTVDARTCIRFKVVPTGPAAQAIVVEAVADGSSAAQAGVQRGMRLAAISDPVRRNEVWELQDRPSIRYIRDVLRMRSSPLIELRFTQPTAELLTAMEAADDALQLTGGSSSSQAEASSSSSSTTAGGGSDTEDSILSLTSLSSSEQGGASTMAEWVQQQFEQKQQASSGVVAYKQRQQRRKEYMEQAGQRSNNTIVLILGASFLLPALVILGVAWGSGYLDALYSNTMSNMR